MVALFGLPAVSFGVLRRARSEPLLMLQLVRGGPACPAGRHNGMARRTQN